MNLFKNVCPEQILFDLFFYLVIGNAISFWSEGKQYIVTGMLLVTLITISSFYLSLDFLNAWNRVGKTKNINSITKLIKRFVLPIVFFVNISIVMIPVFTAGVILNQMENGFWRNVAEPIIFMICLPLFISLFIIFLFPAERQWKAILSVFISYVFLFCFPVILGYNIIETGGTDLQAWMAGISFSAFLFCTWKIMKRTSLPEKLSNKFKTFAHFFNYYWLKKSVFFLQQKRKIIFRWLIVSFVIAYTDLVINFGFTDEISPWLLLLITGAFSTRIMLVLMPPLNMLNFLSFLLFVFSVIKFAGVI